MTESRVICGEAQEGVTGQGAFAPNTSFLLPVGERRVTSRALYSLSNPCQILSGQAQALVSPGGPGARGPLAIKVKLTAN